MERDATVSNVPSGVVDDALALVRAGEPLTAVLARVVEVAAEKLPSEAWGAIAGVDPAPDVDHTTAWLLRQLESRPPPDDVAAVWFGLYEVRGPVPGRTEVFLAVAGGPRAPEPEPQPGWLSAKSWDPPGYAPAPGLRSLLPLAAEAGPEVRALVRSAVVLAYGVGLTAAVLDAVDPKVVLAGRPQLTVATVAAEGGPVVVGVLTDAGLDRSGVAEP